MIVQSAPTQKARLTGRASFVQQNYPELEQIIALFESVEAADAHTGLPVTTPAPSWKPRRPWHDEIKWQRPRCAIGTTSTSRLAHTATIRLPLPGPRLRGYPHQKFGRRSVKNAVAPERCKNGRLRKKSMVIRGLPIRTERWCRRQSREAGAAPPRTAARSAPCLTTLMEHDSCGLDHVASNKTIKRRQLPRKGYETLLA
jgi:hypothetical protein